MTKRLLQNVLILGCVMLLFTHVNESYATDNTDNTEEIENKETDDSEIFGVEALPSEKQSSDRNVKFDVIYDVEEPETDEANSQNVLAPAEPKDEMIEEITNKDKGVEEIIDESSEEPDATLEGLEEDVELEDANESLEDTEDSIKEKAVDKNSQQSAYDEHGKITEEGLTYLDDTVNSVMSKKIVKSPSKKHSNVQKTPQDKRNEAFIRDRMTNFLSFQSLNDKKEKTFVRNLVVESIIVKYTSATKLPL